MPEPRTHRVHVTPRPNGVDLNVEGFVHQTLTDVIVLLTEHPELMDDLDRIIGGTTPPDPYHPERDLPTEDLVRRMAAALPTAIRLHKPEVTALADSLNTVVQAQARRPLAVLPEQGRRAS